MSGEAEKQHALYMHKLEVRKLVLDKLLIGVLILAVGFAANFTIERYRVQSTKERFLLEKKLEAIQQISQSYFSMHNTFDTMMLNVYLNDGHYKKMQSQIDDFINVWTHNSVILSAYFTQQMDYVTRIYIALSGMDLETMRNYRTFFFDVYSKFYALTKKELGLPQESTDVTFDFVEWSVEKADALGADKYLEENFNQWKSKK